MMLAVILVIVLSTVRLIGSNAGNVFSLVGSAIRVVCIAPEFRQLRYFL